MTDYENDPRPLSDCIREFALLINGGKEYGSRGAAAKELRCNRRTLDNFIDGRPTPYDAMIRRLMTLIVKKRQKDPE